MRSQTRSALSNQQSAFVPSIPRRCRPKSRVPVHHQHHALRPISRRLQSSTHSVHHRSVHNTASSHPNLHYAFPIFCVQTRPVSGDNDGEVHHTPPQPKSYSVGVTVVSGFDAQLRRNVIEKIVADSQIGRVVVVTTGGITSTDEQDGQPARTPVSPPDQTLEFSSPQDQIASTAQINGHATSVPILNDDYSSPGVNNLEGWISCSSPAEMAEVVAKLSSSRECDYVIAEGSLDNNMEPQELAQLLRSRCGASLRIDSLVSVLDGDTVLQDLSALPSKEQHENESSEEPSDLTDQPAKPHEGIQDTADTRPMMVVSLVENANVIIVNQNDESPQQDQLARVQNLVSVLNDSADIVPATSDVVPVDRLVNTNAYDQASVSLSATWKKVLIASRNAERGSSKAGLSKTLKETTFVYRAKRPFHPTRLYEHIKAVATFEGVIRSTGRIWLATRMLAPLEWNQAGVAATLRVGKLFWAAVPETQWPAEEEEREKIMSNWDTQYGDRETEIVFVGMDIDKVRLEGLLDGCLLQDEEMVFNSMWENFEDPFVEWVPLIEDDEDVSRDGNSVPDGSSSVQEDKLDQESGESMEMDDSENIIDTGNDLEDEASISALAYEGDNGQSDPGKDNIHVEEGYIETDELPEDVVERLSALDIFEQGFSEDSTAEVIPQPADDGSFDETEAVIASWDGADADDILMQVPKSGLPVTIVTGFLGSGKTTLLNYILTANHGFRIAVLVNEFGEIDIDNQLVEKGEWSNQDEVLQLANGCICCSINDSFVAAVGKILERLDDFDYLIVETTGVADPAPVINSLMVSDLADSVRVDGILTLVDAENFDPKTHMGSEAALSQIMAADTILLSKTDIASAHAVEMTLEFIKSVRPAARILKSQRGRVPIHMILDVGVRVADSALHMDPHRGEPENGSGAEGSEAKGQDEGRRDLSNGHHGHNHDHSHDGDHECGTGCTHESHSHEHSHGNHLDADGFVTTSFKSDRALDPDLFMNKFLGRLPEGVFRAKGLLRFYGFRQRYVFQLSGRRYQFEEDEWPEGVAPGNQMVIIGRDLDLEQLRNTLESCLSPE